MPKPEEVGSFLAFLYHIRFDPDTRKRFTWPDDYDRSTGKPPAPKGDGIPHPYEQVMEEYKLTPAQRDLMVAVDWAMASKDAAVRVNADDLWQKLVMQLLPEFRAWTEGEVYGGAAAPQPAHAPAAVDGPGKPKWW